MIVRIGAIVDKANEAAALVFQIRASFATLKFSEELRTAYFIWREPYMVAAGDTFINDMMKRAGFVNVFGHLSRYPKSDKAMLREADPEVILLSSEPYPFQEKHAEKIAHSMSRCTHLFCRRRIVFPVRQPAALFCHIFP